MPNPADTRSDADNLRRLEELRPAFDRLSKERIRAESEIERLQAELDAARALARDELGTDDPAAIAELVAEARARNTSLVDEFAALVRSIEARLKALAGNAP